MWKAEGQSQLWTGWFKLSEHVRCVTFVSQSVTVFLLSPVCVCHRWFLGLNRSSSKIGPVVVHLLNLTRYGLLSLYLSTPASDLRPAGLDELFDQITKKQSDSPSLFISFCLRFYPLFPTFLFIFFLFLLPLSLFYARYTDRHQNRQVVCHLPFLSSFLYLCTPPLVLPSISQAFTDRWLPVWVANT